MGQGVSGGRMNLLMLIRPLSLSLSLRVFVHNVRLFIYCQLTKRRDPVDFTEVDVFDALPPTHFAQVKVVS